jgi:hypothetical protein
MRFKVLSDEELQANEQELIQFLIVNGIDGAQWEKMNKEAPEKALALVELFSDIVWERLLVNTSHLEFRSANKLFVFHCGPQEIELVALQSDFPQVDFSTPERIHEGLIQFPGQVTYFTQKKGYNPTREDELFRMIQQGCVRSSDTFFNALKQVISNG